MLVAGDRVRVNLQMVSAQSGETIWSNMFETPATDVFSLVFRQGAKLAAIGTIIGLLIAYSAGRLISQRLYAISASDPLILGGAVLLVAAIAALATTIPALRASRMNPAQALHHE